MLVNTLTVISVLLGLVRLEEPCSPKIKEGDGPILGIGGLISLDCSFTTCDRVSTVVFKREGVAVYEALSNGDHAALGISSGYSLKNRSVYYFATRTYHILNIDPAKLNDHGKWSCLVIDANRDEYASKEIMINIYAKPSDEDILKSQGSKTFVTDRPQTFTCEVKDVHPRPTFTWTLNGEQKDRAPGEPVQQADGLWSLKSTIEHTFSNPGNVKLECVLSAGDKQAWINDTIGIDVKESAKVISTTYPKEHVLPNATFTLTCVGSGYGHRITWKKDGNLIRNGEIYDIQGCEDAQYKKCTSTVKSRPVKEESECYKMYDYSWKYTCIVQLETPYNSKDESPEMKIQVSNAPITIGTAKNTTSRRCSETTTLRCDVCSRNPISDEWYIGGVPINRADVEHALHGEIQSSHFYYGQYKRIVETSEGKTECVVHYVEGGYDICSGEIIGIVIGVIMLVIVLIGAVVFWYLQTRKKRTEDLDIENEYENVHTVTTSTSNPLPVPSRPVEAASDDVNQENSSHNAEATNDGDERTYMRLDNDGQAVYVNRDVNVYDIINK